MNVIAVEQLPAILAGGRTLVGLDLGEKTLGVDPATIPPLVARACILDTVLILAIWAFRRRQAISAWVRRKRERYQGIAASPSA